MAFTFSLNNVHSPQRALYELKEKLKAAGWTCQGSGDGDLLFSPSSDVLTTYSTSTDPVPGAVTNRRAWWRLRDPNGRELLFQHAAFNIASDYISCAYSRSAGFVGTGDGALAPNVAPTATDAFLFAGERRPSDILNGDSFSGTYTITRVDYIIGDASEGYSFACFLRQANGLIRGGMLYDVLVNPSLDDLDPIVVAHIGSYTFDFWESTQDQRGFWTWGDAGVGSVDTITQSNGGPQKHPPYDPPRVDAGQRVCLASFCYWDQNITLAPGGVNPYGGTDLVEPVYWYSAALPSQFPGPFAGPQVGGIHGESRIIKARSTNAGFANMDTNSARTRAAQAPGFWVIWDGATTPLL